MQRGQTSWHQCVSTAQHTAQPAHAPPKQLQPSAHLYTLTLGLASSSSLMTPHLVNTRTISASVASGGNPETYTLLFFCS